MSTPSAARWVSSASAAFYWETSALASTARLASRFATSSDSNHVTVLRMLSRSRTSASVNAITRSLGVEQGLGNEAGKDLLPLLGGLESAYGATFSHS